MKFQDYAVSFLVKIIKTESASSRGLRTFIFFFLVEYVDLQKYYYELKIKFRSVNLLFSIKVAKWRLRLKKAPFWIKSSMKEKLAELYF